MKDERMLILSMLQEGKISAEEAASLLEALGAAKDLGDEFDVAGPGTGSEGRPRRDGYGRDAGRDSTFQVDLGAMWDDAMHLVGKARDKVETAIERTRRRMEQAGDQARHAQGEARRAADEAVRAGKDALQDVGERAMHAGERAMHAGERAVDAGGDMLKDAGDFFKDVERGLAKVATELPDAVARFMRLEFGPAAQKEVAWHYEGGFPSDDDIIEIFASSDDGTIRLEGVDGDEYRVDVVHKVRTDDEEEAAAMAKNATRWELSDTGFQIATGLARDVRGDIVLRLPKGFKYAVDLQTSDGGIVVQDVDVVDLRVNSADGSVRMERVTAGSIETSTADGGIRMTDVEADRVTAASSNGSIRITGDIGVLRATCSDGSVAATYTVSEAHRREHIKWHVRSSDGGIRIQVPHDEDIGYEYDLSTADGTVRVQLPDVESAVSGTDRRGVHGFTPDFEAKSTRFIVRARTADGSVSLRTAE